MSGLSWPGVFVVQLMGRQAVKRYESFEDVLSEYLTATSYADKAIWAQCDVLVQAHGDGYDIEAVASKIAYAARCSRSTIYNRYRTGRVFPPDKRDLSLSPHIHAICAAEVDLRSNEPDYDAAYTWLALAAENEYSTRELTKAIKDSKPEAVLNEPVVLLKAVDAVIISYDTLNGFITLKVADVPLSVTCDMCVTLTLVQAPAQALEAA